MGPAVLQPIGAPARPLSGRRRWGGRVALLVTTAAAIAGAPVQTSDGATDRPRLLFLGNRNIPPVVYLEGERPSGVAVDLVRALEPHLPRAVEIRATDWQAAQAQVLQGEADALIQMNPTEERRKQYDFSEPLLESRFAIFARSDAVGFTDAASLRGARVGVEAAGLPRQVLSAQPAIQLEVIPDFLTGFRRVAARELDAVVVDDRVGSWVIARNRIANVVVTGQPVASSWSAIAVRKGNAELLAAIDEGLRRIRGDGTYQRVLDRWRPQEVVYWTREQLAARIAGAAAVALAALLLVTAGWMVLLRRELRRRRAAAERLRRQNAVLGGVIEGADALIFSVDRDYRYASFNSRHAQTMKTLYGAEIAPGASLLEAMTNEADRETARKNLDRALAGEGVVGEAYSGGPGHPRRYFRVAHFPVRGEAGEVMGAVVLAQDLTERKEAEDTVRRINRELRALTSCNRSLMRDVDEATLLADVCRIICEEAGYRMAWVGYPGGDEARSVRPVAWAGVENGYLGSSRITWDDSERGRGPTGTALRTGTAAFFDDFALDPAAGPWREAALANGYRSSAAFPLKDAGGQTFGVLSVYSTEPGVFTHDERGLLAELAGDLALGVGVLRSRAELQRAEQALRRSEEQYRRIVETAHEGIWVGDAGGRTTFVNRQMAEMLGYAVAEMQGLPAAAIFDEDGRRFVERQAEGGGRSAGEQQEFRLRRKEGPELWGLVEATPLFDERGSYSGMLAMVTEVTERRTMEAQLRQAQKLDAVGRLAGGVAHDFNNLLTAILGNAQLLAEDLEPGSTQREEAEEIEATAHRATLLTRQLLAFGRKQATEPRVVDLGEVVGAMDRMLRRIIGEDVEVTTAVAPGLGRVRVDPVQVEQVILNLAVNARDAMPGGGRLTIEARDADAPGQGAPAAGGGRWVMLAVRDTGSGMSPEVQSHLFEPFFTTKGPGKGTGLGLATVYGIVKQAGGEVRIQSEPGKGSSFEVYFPRLEAAAEALPPPPAREAPRGTETVMVVEDEPMVRSLAVRVLRDAGYTVVDAGDAEQALQLLSATPHPPIDLLLTDVVMPRVSGPDLADRVRAGWPELPVLFASGYMDGVVDVHERLGLRTGFIPKPFTPVELARKVRELLDRREGATARPPG